MDDLTGEFIAETRETLENIGEALVAWEAEPADTARLDEIFRFVHTVKGSCGFLDLARIEALAHAAETVLGEMRAGARGSDRHVVGAMLRVIDRIARLVDALDTDAEFPPVEGDHALIAALEDPRPQEPRIAAEAEQAKGRVRNVRVAVDLLDAMMSQVSDLVLVRNDLARRVRTVRGDSAAEASLDRLSTCVADLRDSVARARMQPVERLFAALPRLVRDTAESLGKDVDLVIAGSNVELDREMVEQLRDPLVHMVRNAIDHGVETPSDRRAANKPARAVLKVEARQSGNQIAITIADDGRGIDCARLRHRATDAGLLDSRTAAAMDDIAAANLVFMPGLSTADTVSAISGRGVGMDIVRANVERLGGTIMIDNRPGRGLTVEIRAPLTLSIVSVLSITAGGQMFAVPRASVDEVLALRPNGIVLEQLGDGLIARVRGSALPVVSLSIQTGGDAGTPSHLVVIDNGGGHRWALATDTIGSHEEVVIRPVAPVVAASGLFAGQALPDDGKPLLILDVLGLARLARIDSERTVARDVVPDAILPTVALIAFTTLCGERRAVPLNAVERIVDMPRSAFTAIGNAVIVNDDGMVFAASVDGALPDGERLPMLRLARGAERIGLLVGDAQDLVRIAPDAIVDTVVGRIAMIEGHAVPMIDLDMLFEAPEVAVKPSSRTKVAA